MLKKLREIYSYRQMLRSLVLTDLRTRYKGSILGFFWTFLNPLLMLLVYSILFKYVMKMNLENYTAFLFIGLLPWFLFNQSIQSSAGVIIRNAGLVKKIYFPKEILPISVIIGGLINYLFSFIILVPLLLISNIQLSWIVLWFPVILLVTLIFSLALSLLISSLNVYFRDLEHIMGIILMAWFYMTPVIYPEDMIPNDLKTAFSYNPMKVIVQSYQDIFYYNQVPNLLGLAVVGIISLLIMIIGFYVFFKLSKNFAEEI
ncbi:ABC transporter permease [Brevibacillus sp. 179-C9.3 HS]|uniref:ABC transporter permease n=1 Tax=unclassified Brevibacillus TaxID=2684853 RepID=UPI0039A16710